MISNNVLNRVRRIECGNLQGTAFTLDYQNKQYLVTAKHVVEGSQFPRTMRLVSPLWADEFDFRLIGLSPHTDIAVLACDTLLSPTEVECPATIEGLTYGQDVYFVGYPYGLEGIIESKGEIYRLPLVKKACLSTFTEESDVGVLVLDGHNNRGFSGAPVVYQVPGNSRLYNFAGVISGYIPEYEPARIGGVDGEFQLLQNSGIIIAYNIRHAIEVITDNPDGSIISR